MLKRKMSIYFCAMSLSLAVLISGCGERALEYENYYAGSIYIPDSVDTAQYKNYRDNPIKFVAKDPVSTFGLDMDTGSYANVRRFISQGKIPPPDAVRVEEFINYFPPASNELLKKTSKLSI